MGTGGVLYQIDKDGNKLIIELTSQSLAGSERHYSATKKELLGVVRALRKFRYYLYGTKFTLQTDHRAFQFLMTQRNINPLVERWFHLISEYNFVVEHIPGVKNVLPDHLSRIYPEWTWYKMKDEKSENTPAFLNAMTTNSMRMSMGGKKTPISLETDDWQLNPGAAKRLWSVFGTPEIDAFATQQNALLDEFWTAEDDALNQNWTNRFLWMNPPWRIIKRISDKILEEKPKVILICPKHIIPNELYNFVRSVIILQHHQNLFLPKRTENQKGVGTPPWETTVALYLDGNEYKGHFEEKFRGILTQTSQIIPIINKGEIDLEDFGEREKIIRDIHSFGHFSAPSLAKQITALGVSWPGMREEINEFVKKCPQCARHNIVESGFLPAQSSDVLLPGEHIIIDYMGPFQETKNGSVMCLVIVDKASRYLTLRPTKDKSAETTAATIWQYSCDYGIPDILQTDNDPSFVNQIMQLLCKRRGMEHRRITPYYPQANGLVERMVRTSKEAMNRVLDGAGPVWDEVLGDVQIGINLLPRTLLGTNAFSAFFGRPPRHLKDKHNTEKRLMSTEEIAERIKENQEIIQPALRERRNQKQKIQHERLDSTRKSADFKEGDWVRLRHQMRDKGQGFPNYSQPMQIAKINKGQSLQLRELDGEIHPRPVHVSQVKHTEPPNDETADRFEVENIKGHRSLGKDENGVELFKYLVKWRGYEARTWEPEENFDSKIPIRQYWRSFEKRKSIENLTNFKRKAKRQRTQE